MRRFAAQSPARHVQRICEPVSHAYGSRDRNVDFANGQLIKAAFEKAGKPFEWVFVADEEGLATIKICMCWSSLAGWKPFCVAMRGEQNP
jgi:hypothetical protein